MNLWWRSAKGCCCVMRDICSAISCVFALLCFLDYFCSFFFSILLLILFICCSFTQKPGTGVFPPLLIWHRRVHNQLETFQLPLTHPLRCKGKQLLSVARHEASLSAFWVLGKRWMNDSHSALSFWFYFLAGPNHIKFLILCKAGLTHFCPGVRRLYQSLALMTSTNANQAHQCASRGRKVTTCQWEFSISSQAELPVASLQVAVNQDHNS